MVTIEKNWENMITEIKLGVEDRKKVSGNMRRERKYTEIAGKGRKGKIMSIWLKDNKICLNCSNLAYQ